MVKPSDILPAAVLAPLTRKSDWRGVALVVHCWAVIFAAMAFFAWWPNPLSFAIAAIVITAVVWVSDPALAVLNRMRLQVNLGGFVFPGQKRDKPLSNMAILNLLERRATLTRLAITLTEDTDSTRREYPSATEVEGKGD